MSSAPPIIEMPEFARKVFEHAMLEQDRIKQANLAGDMQPPWLYEGFFDNPRPSDACIDYVSVHVGVTHEEAMEYFYRAGRGCHWGRWERAGRQHLKTTPTKSDSSACPPRGPSPGKQKPAEREVWEDISKVASTIHAYFTPERMDLLLTKFWKEYPQEAVEMGLPRPRISNQARKGAIKVVSDTMLFLEGGLGSPGMEPVGYSFKIRELRNQLAALAEAWPVVKESAPSTCIEGIESVLRAELVPVLRYGDEDRSSMYQSSQIVPLVTKLRVILNALATQDSAQVPARDTSLITPMSPTTVPNSLGSSDPLSDNEWRSLKDIRDKYGIPATKTGAFELAVRRWRRTKKTRQDADWRKIGDQRIGSRSASYQYRTSALTGPIRQYQSRP